MNSIAFLMLALHLGQPSSKYESQMNSLLQDAKRRSSIILQIQPKSSLAKMSSREQICYQVLRICIHANSADSQSELRKITTDYLERNRQQGNSIEMEFFSRVWALLVREYTRVGNIALLDLACVMPRDGAYAEGFELFIVKAVFIAEKKNSKVTTVLKGILKRLFAGVEDEYLGDVYTYLRSQKKSVLKKEILSAIRIYKLKQ
jgi:hypothetical protein